MSVLTILVQNVPTQYNGHINTSQSEYKSMYSSRPEVFIIQGTECLHWELWKYDWQRFEIDWKDILILFRRFEGKIWGGFFYVRNWHFFAN